MSSEQCWPSTWSDGALHANGSRSTLIAKSYIDVANMLRVSCFVITMMLSVHFMIWHGSVWVTPWENGHKWLYACLQKKNADMKICHFVLTKCTDTDGRQIDWFNTFCYESRISCLPDVYWLPWIPSSMLEKGCALLQIFQDWPYCAHVVACAVITLNTVFLTEGSVVYKMCKCPFHYIAAHAFIFQWCWGRCATLWLTRLLQRPSWPL